MPDLYTVLAILIIWLAAGPILGLALIFSAEELLYRKGPCWPALVLSALGILIGGPILWALTLE